jgi:uncharacterized LabA/DUF88 family protein
MKNTDYISTTTEGLRNFRFEFGNTITTINTEKSISNWAFIDMQNLYKSVQDGGWKINWNLFRKYLVNYHNVTTAVVFMGYIKKYDGIYTRIKKAGFIIEFREVSQKNNGIIDGGNVDADLAAYMMDYKRDYDKAILIADDGDYTNTIRSLVRQNKLKTIISSHPIKSTSKLIRKEVSPNLILSIDSIRNLVELK